jgi:hypothetical protein
MIPRDCLAMDDAVRKAKLVALVEETEAIHFANMLYWNCKVHSHEADMGISAETKTTGTSSERIW